jgi:RimJ/RimL family protein N-acetyltransferase
MTPAVTPDLQPTLRGALVALRPLAVADWAALFAVASDPLIWAVHPAHDRWQEPVFRQFFDEALASRGGLVATDPTSGAVIGFSRYDLKRVEAGEVEIGWTFLARTYWGGATNADMKRLMIGHALRYFDRALFLVGETNARSRRAMEKIGGRLTDRFDDFEFGGRTTRHVIYAIDRERFAAGPLAIR